MVVLGQTSEEKGAQLEQLTAAVLKSLGYTDIHANVIFAGASEVDVVGKYSIPLPGSNSVVDIIGECKAYRERVGMNDWHKLLGKLHVARLKNSNVIAVLLALNGFNGNVIGAHEEYDRLCRNQIFLISREAIEEAVRKILDIASVQSIEANLRRLTNTAVTGLEMAYYEHSVYWLAEFADGRYAIMDAKGALVSVDSGSKLARALEFATGRNEFVDLQAEQQARLRILHAAKVQLASLFLLGGKARGADISVDPDFAAEEFAVAMDLLVESSLVLRRENVVELSFLNAFDQPSVFSKTLLFWFEGPIPAPYVPLLLGSDTYKAGFNGQLVVYGLDLQGRIPVPSNRFDELLWLLMMSPSAVKFFLTPQAFFLQHRVEQSISNEAIDQDDVKSLFDNLVLRFTQDFRHQVLHSFYLESAQIFELEHQEQVTVKGVNGVVFNQASNSRTAIVPVVEEFGGMYALVRIVEGSKGPWESPEEYPRSFPDHYRRATADKEQLYKSAQESS